jgi:hypothetical protein
MGNHEKEIEIKKTPRAQVDQLLSLSSQILKAAEDPQAAESAIAVVNRAYAYNSTDQRLMKVANIIIEKAGKFLGTVSPQAGLLLSRFGQVLLSDEIYPLTISFYLKSVGLELSSEVSEEDLPFYEMIKNGELYREGILNNEIGKWILGQNDWESPETEKDPKILALRRLSDFSPRNTLRELVTKMVMGEGLPTDEQLVEIRKLVQEAEEQGATREEIYAASHQKPQKKSRRKTPKK